MADTEQPDPTPNVEEENTSPTNESNALLGGDDAAAATSSSDNVFTTDLGKAVDGLTDTTVRTLGTDVTYSFRVCEPKVNAGTFTDMAYWVYHVKTTTTNPNWKGPSSDVTRRYNEFTWLRESLADAYPGMVVPPLPPKVVKGAVEKIVMSDTSLLEYRQRALTKFLCSVGAHPQLSTSELLRVFCEGTTEEFDMFRAKRKIEMGMEHPKEGIAVRTRHASRKLTGGAPPSLEHSFSDVVVKHMNHMRKQKEALDGMKKSLNVLVEARKNHATTFNEVATNLERLAKVEAMVDSTDTSPTSRDVTSMSVYCTELAGLMEEQGMKELCLVTEAFRYFAGVCDSVMEAIEGVYTIKRHVHHLEQDHRSAQHDFDKTSDKSGIKGITAQTKAEHYGKLVEKEKEKEAVAVRNLEQDLARAMAANASDWKNTLCLFIEVQASLARRVQHIDMATITDPLASS
eukprot:PhM_4_TR10295/c0_g2_i1/m.77247/K17917/SNX1_2; sorting nexin-1/2